MVVRKVKLKEQDRLKVEISNSVCMKKSNERNQRSLLYAY